MTKRHACKYSHTLNTHTHVITPSSIMFTFFEKKIVHRDQNMMNGKEQSVWWREGHLKVRHSHPLTQLTTHLGSYHILPVFSGWFLNTRMKGNGQCEWLALILCAVGVRMTDSERGYCVVKRVIMFLHLALKCDEDRNFCCEHAHWIAMTVGIEYGHSAVMMSN